MSSDESERPRVPSGADVPGPDVPGPDVPGPDVSGPPLDGGADLASPASPSQGRPAGSAGPLVIYTALRVGLIALLTAVLSVFMPLIVALLFAIIIQLPLAWLLFAGPRRRVNEAMALSSAHRRGERERLRAALAGEQDPPDRPTG